MKDKKLIILISIFIIIITIIFIGNIQNEKQKLDILLKNQGFSSKTNSNYYKMQLSKNNLKKYNQDVENNKKSNFSEIYYDGESFQILKTKMDFQEEVTSVYNATYSYENKEINYTARFTFSTANVIVRGTYQEKNKNFDCEVDFSYDVIKENIKESLCKKSQFETNEFIKNKDKIFTKEINNIIISILKNEE